MIQGGDPANSPSIDRLVPALGYIPINCRWICVTCNDVKGGGDARLWLWCLETLAAGIAGPMIIHPDATPRRRSLMVDAARRRTRETRVPFSITREDVVVPIECPILGVPLSFGIGRQHNGSPTLDRFIPELGYVPDNVLVLSCKANTMKGATGPREWRRYLGECEARGLLSESEVARWRSLVYVELTA
jgi:hypothetical protein